MHIKLAVITIQFFFVSQSVSCYAQHEKIVLINKKNSWDQSFFSYFTPYSMVPITYFDMRNNHVLDQTKYIVEIPTHEPLFFAFSWNFKFQLVCLFPGDTLEFRSTSNDSIPFQFGGSRPYNELMFHSLLETSKLGILVGNQDLDVTDRLNFQYVAEQTLERYEARLELLYNLSGSSKFSDQGRSIIAQSLYYRYLNELLFPYQAWRPIEDIGKNVPFVPDSYKTKLRNLENEFAKDSLLYLYDYRRFIMHYARFLMLEKSGEEQINLTSLLDFYKRTFRGKKRDLLLFDEVHFNYGMTRNVSPIDQVIDSIGNKAMRDTLISIQRKSIKGFSKHAMDSELETPTGEKHTLLEILSWNAKKLVFLDLWATWCGPCLMEMPDSGKLTEEFKDDSIEFIYLSIDEDKQKWLKKLAVLPAGSNVHHYRLSDGASFIKEMKIPSVPRYVLIGKDGQTISFDAPRPRSMEIRRLISQYN